MLRLIVAPGDALCAVLLLPLAAALLLWNRLAPRATGRGALLHLSGGSSTAEVIDKFGSLEMLFLTVPGTEAFTGNVMFWFPTRQSLTLRLDNGWTVLEQRKAFGVLPLTGIALYVIRAAHAIRRHGVAAIRAWDPYYSGLAGWLFATTARLPFAVSIHADYDKGYELAGAAGAPVVLGSRRWAKTMERFVLRRADLVMPIRSALTANVAAAGVAAGRIHLIPHGIDLTPFDRPADDTIRATLGLDPERKIVSFAGRLALENYVDDVIDVARGLAERRDDFVLVMAGGGPEADRLAGRIAGERALARCIIATGPIERSQVLALRRASALSLCLMGGFSLIEACAAGRPVLSYDVDWHGELVRDGETGFLLGEGDVAGLVAAASRLLDDEALAERLGAAARRLAFARHGLETTTDIKRQAYARLLKKGAR